MSRSGCIKWVMKSGMRERWGFRLPSPPSTFPPTCFKACPPTPPTQTCLPFSVLSSISRLALSFSFNPSLLQPSHLFHLSAPPTPLHLCPSVSLSLHLLRQAVKHGGELCAVETTAGEPRAVKCSEQRLHRPQSWGWVTELRTLDYNEKRMHITSWQNRKASCFNIDVKTLLQHHILT